MDNVTVNAYGKINLSLNVGPKRADGYHELLSVMQSVDIADVINVRKNESGKINLFSSSSEIPLDETNIAYRAAELMKSTFLLNSGYDIFVEKNIPIGGGMAGGSTDGAAVLRAICQLENLDLAKDKLIALGKKLGADVPFCIFQKTALATGIGEKLKEIPAFCDYYIVLVNPNIFISTAKIFALMDEEARIYTTKTDMPDALLEGNFERICASLGNDMQKYTEKMCPEIRKITDGLLRLGAGGAIMSGSGSTCFGLFKNEPELLKIKSEFKDYWVKIVRPTN